MPLTSKKIDQFGPCLPSSRVLLCVEPPPPCFGAFLLGFLRLRFVPARFQVSHTVLNFCDFPFDLPPDLFPVFEVLAPAWPQSNFWSSSSCDGRRVASQDSGAYLTLQDAELLLLKGSLSAWHDFSHTTVPQSSLPGQRTWQSLCPMGR